MLACALLPPLLATVARRAELTLSTPHTTRPLSGGRCEIPISNVLEPKILDQLFGPVVAQCNQAISAGTTAQTSITIRGSAGSGNADHTPVVGEFWLIATPGAAGSENQYTNVDVFQVSGTPTATSLTFASRTVVAARAVGDVCFVLNTTTGLSAFGNVPLLQKVFVGLSTTGAQTTIAAASDLAALPQGTITVASTTGFAASGNIIIVSEKGEQNIAYTGTTATTFTGATGGTGTIDTGDTVYQVPTAATILSNEPTSTGGYARVAVVNNAANFGAATGSYPASKNNATQITFPQSTAAWSSGATGLDIAFLADSSTLAGGNIITWWYVSPAQTVNAANITPNLPATTGFVQTLL